jgi:putative aldouronate transport system substrate-binding protein
MQMKFITGEEPLTNFDAYIDTLDKMGVNTLIQAYQAAYDRYQAR